MGAKDFIIIWYDVASIPLYRQGQRSHRHTSCPLYLLFSRQNSRFGNTHLLNDVCSQIYGIKHDLNIKVQSVEE